MEAGLYTDTVHGVRPGGVVEHLGSAAVVTVRVWWSGSRSPELVRSCLMVRSLHPVMRAILRGPYPWLVRSQSWSASRAAMARTGSPARMSGAGLRFVIPPVRNRFT